MNRTSTIRRNLKEDKIIAKEDECSVSTGDVSSPSEKADTQCDVQSAVKNNGSISTTDILGHCDHKKDGFFGPGCMHRPMPIFSYPLSRIKRKKNKYAKIIDLTESDEFEQFDSTAKSIAQSEIGNANEYLSKVGLRCNIDYEHKFSGNQCDWPCDMSIHGGTEPDRFSISLNIPQIYRFLEVNSLENDEDELRCQIRALIFHEIGHAIIQKFRNDPSFDFELDDCGEEELVDEFTRFIMREYTGKMNSRINEFITEIFS